MNKLLLFISLSFSGIIFGQNTTFKIDNLLLERISELDADKVGFTRKSCTGYEVNSKGYIFWKKSSIIYIQKVHFIEYPKTELITYQPIELQTDFFFSNFEKNKKNIENEKEVKHFQIQIDDEQEIGTLSTGYIQIPHSCYGNIYIKSEKYSYNKKFDYFDFTKSLRNSETEKNINFEFNQNLKTVELNNLINKEIEQIESEIEFIIEN